MIDLLSIKNKVVQKIEKQKSKKIKVIQKDYIPVETINEPYLTSGTVDLRNHRLE
jgi:hypothetical protein